MWQKVIERWTWVFSEPLGAVFFAGVAVIALVAVTHRQHRAGRAGGSRLSRVARGGAVMVITAWLLDLMLRSFALFAGVLAWWTYALPLVFGALAVGVAATTGPPTRRRTGAPTLVGVRRTWMTFPSRMALGGVAVACVALVALTLICGVVSIPDERGAFVWADFGAAGTGSFYGWTFGIPVLVGLALLTLATMIALARIAAPPFRSPDTAARERRERTVAADSVLALAGGSTALSLGASLYFVGRMGSSSAGVGISGVGDFEWTPGYSALAPALQWTGWGILFVGTVVLLGLLVGRVPFTWAARPGALGSLGPSANR